MNVDFKGYNENVATFVADETVQAGAFVKMGGNFTVTACGADDEFIGVCVNARDGYCAVQLSGYVEAPATAVISTGYQALCASDSETVKAGTASNKYLVIYSDETKIGFII